MLSNYKLIPNDQKLLHKPCKSVSKRKGLKIADILIKEIKANKPICIGMASNQIGLDKVVRYGWIKVKTKLGVYEFGKRKPSFNDYLTCVAVQHEIDHLNGVTIMDKCLQPMVGTKKPKRNSPCHCGSGNKYKNCCL